MSETSLSPSRRVLLATSAAAGAFSLLPTQLNAATEDRQSAPSASTFRKRRSSICADEVIYFNEVDKGGHFAAWEKPELFSTEIRAAFRSLRQAM